jgi:outer membrane receptor for ferrienterochelin and colicins
MNKISIIISIILIILFSSIKLEAHEITINQSKENEIFKVSGTVKSFEGDPIENAFVVLVGIQKTTETDEKGNFVIKDLISGRHHIEVIAKGYLEFHDDFDLQKDMILDIKLVKIPSEEIVVTGTKTEKLYTETPVKTVIVSSREIEQKAATQLAESLSGLTGVRVESTCQSCNLTQVRINGMSGEYSQILIDSSPVFSAMVGAYGLQQIPVEMIESIEIIKGGGSSLYGGDAVAGVINVLSREPQENKTSLRLHQQSDKGEPQTNVGFWSSAISKDGNRKGYLFANYKSKQPVDLNEDSLSELGRLKGTNFGLNFINSVSGIRGKLKLGLFRLSEDRRGGDLFDKPPHEANLAEWINSDIFGLAVDWNHYLTDSMYYDIEFSHVHAERDTYFGAEKALDAYGKTYNPVSFLNTMMNTQIGSHLISSGFQFKREKISDKNFAYSREIDEVYNELGFIAQDDFKLGKSFSFLMGFRLTSHSLIDGLIFSPRMSLLVDLAKKLSWRTSFSSGFRAPQVFNKDLDISQINAEGMIIENSPELKEEKSYSVTTGFDYGERIGETLCQISIESFYTTLNNTFMLDEKEIDPRKNTLILERINGSNARVYGISADFNCRISNYLNLATGLTLQRSHLGKPEPNFGAKEFFRMPTSHGYVQLNFANSKFFDLNLSLEYTGKMKIPHFAGYIDEDRLETGQIFYVINTKFKKNYDFNKESGVDFFVGIYNLLDSYQRDLDKGLYRDSSYIYGPIRPRSFYAGFEYFF